MKSSENCKTSQDLTEKSQSSEDLMRTSDAFKKKKHVKLTANTDIEISENQYWYDIIIQAYTTLQNKVNRWIRYQHIL